MLTDFGAARALEDEEKFTSIYGTEEYLVTKTFFLMLLAPQKWKKKRYRLVFFLFNTKRIYKVLKNVN